MVAPLWMRADVMGSLSEPASSQSLRELTLMLHLPVNTIIRLRSLNLPVLEAIALDFRILQVIHNNSGWRNITIHPLPLVRRAVLLNIDEHTSRIFLAGLPSLERLTVACDENGRIPSYLNNPEHCPNLQLLAILNPSTRKLDRVREKVEKRVGNLRVVAVDERYSTSRASCKMVKWLKEQVEVQVWPTTDFSLHAALDRMQFL